MKSTANEGLVRRSDTILAVVAVGAALAGLTALDARLGDGAAAAARARLVAGLGLTDLALFTEARYTRHPSQADLHSAFQDHPRARDHFPSGSLRSPPHFADLRRRATHDEAMD